MIKKSAFYYFYFLVAGYAISSFGSFLNMVALNLFAYYLTGSALQTGLFMALRLAASFFGGLAAGKVVAQYNRKLVMIASDLTQGLALLLLIFAPSAIQVEILYGLSIVFGLCSTLSNVSLRSSIPEIVGQDQRVRANGLLVTGRSFATVLGFASAGIVVAWAGYETAFLIDAATFFISALNLAWLPLNMRPAEQPDNSQAATPSVGLLESYRVAFTWLKAAPILLVMVFIRTADTFGSASHNVGLPVYANIINPQNPSAFVGRTWAAWAIGSLLAHQLLSRVLKRGDRPISESAFALGTCFMSFFFILVFTGLPLPLMLLVAVGAGLADGVTEIAYTSRLQGMSDEQRGFIFGFSAMAESLGFGVGMILCAWMMEIFSPLYVVSFFHGIAIVLAFLFLLFLINYAQRLGRADSAG